MFVIDNYPLAVAFCIVTMLCWGSWANTQKLAGKRWRFELFYWDYVLGVLLMALIFAFTMGSTGESGRSFLADLRQADPMNLGKAVLGGVLFNAANILLVAAIAIAGMSVAFPVGIGLALVIGVVVTYRADPVGNPYVLFTGVGLIVVAIVLAALAYRQLPRKAGGGVRGLILAVLCGVSMGYFYPLVAGSMPAQVVVAEGAPKVIQFADMPDGLLTPYTAMVFFSLGVLLSQFAYNFSLILRWFTADEVTRPDYLRGSVGDHFWGLLGGMIWAVGMTFNIVASGEAGRSISYGLGQGATLIAAIWGVLIWREFREADRKVNYLLGPMFAGYLIGLALVIAARVV